MESTASTFTVGIEGEKQQQQQQKQNSIFFTFRYTNRKAAAASLYSCRKPGIPSRTRHTLLSNQPHYVSHNPSGRQADSLPPSLAPVCLSLSLSRPPPAVCKHLPYSSLSNILVALVLLLLPKATLSSLLSVAFRCRSSLSSHLLSRLLWFIFLSFPFSLSSSSSSCAFQAPILNSGHTLPDEPMSFTTFNEHAIVFGFFVFFVAPLWKKSCGYG